MDHAANKERDVKNKKFRKMYRNLNLALQEIMKEASIIGESGLIPDNFPDTIEVKVKNQMDSPGEMYCSDEEKEMDSPDQMYRSDEEKGHPLQSDENFNFKSPYSLPINCHVNPVQNLQPPSSDSSECSPVNLGLKYTDSSEEEAYSSEEETVKYDTIKYVRKCSSSGLKNSFSKRSSNREKNLKMKSNSCKLYKCPEPLCDFFTLDNGIFSKHTLMHFKHELKEGTNFDTVPQRIPRPDGRHRIEMEPNPVEHNILHTFDSADGNSLVDNAVHCSLCDFFCFTPVGLKRHYSRYHSNREIQESSEELDYCNDERMNNSDTSLNGEDQLARFSSCNFECHSSRMRKYKQPHHQTVDDGLIGTSKSFKCFECAFETPYRITLVRHEKEHANFINKAKIKYNNNNSHSTRKSCKASRKGTLTINSLDLQSGNPIQDEQRSLKRISLYQKNVNKFNQNETRQNLKARRDFLDSCLDEYQPFKVDIDFEEEERDYPTVGHQEIKKPLNEKRKYKKIGNEYHCENCSYKNHRKRYIKSHILIHLKMKKLKCTQCTYATNMIRNLREHELIHREIKKYVCKLCDYTTHHLPKIRSHHERFHMSNIS